MTTKLDKMMGYGIGLSCTNSHDSLSNKKRYISSSTSSMNTKLDKVVAYDMGPVLLIHEFFLTSELYL